MRCNILYVSLVFLLCPLASQSKFTPRLNAGEYDLLYVQEMTHTPVLWDSLNFDVYKNCVTTCYTSSIILPDLSHNLAKQYRKLSEANPTQYISNKSPCLSIMFDPYFLHVVQSRLTCLYIVGIVLAHVISVQSNKSWEALVAVYECMF